MPETGRESRRGFSRDLLLAAATAVAFGLSFPPFRLGFLAYWCLVPFFFLLSGKNLKEIVRWSYVAGLLVHVATLYWIAWSTVPGAVAALIVLPLFFVLYGIGHHFLASRLGHRFIYAIPFLWTGIEYIRSLGQIGFPWISLGYTQSYYTVLIQYASATSVFGVSFWVAWLNVLVYDFLRSADNRRKRFAIAIALVLMFLLPLLHGLWLMRRYTPAREKVRAALVQGNIDPFRKWDAAFLDENFATYERLTDEAAAEKPALIIWPETAIPTYIRHDAYYLDWMRDRVVRWGAPVLSGAPDYRYGPDGILRTYNAAFLFEPAVGELQWYAKLQLVPFGERVPYQGALGWFKKLLDKLEMGEGDFSPGPGVRLFCTAMPVAPDSLVHDVRFATVICYESVFPDLVRRFVDKGANFLVVITNDGWFGRTSGPYQHARAAVFRAIETRRWVARCANTGISAFIDPLGRVVKRSPLYEEAVLIHDVGLRYEKTFFVRHGNVFSLVVSFANIVPFAIGLLRSEANHRTAQTVDA